MSIEDDLECLKGDPGFQRLVARLRRESPEVLQKVLGRFADLPELAPASPKDGKRFVADRDKVSVTIDSTLLELVQETAENLDVPVSRIVESAVWQFYHKPVLSFQKEQDNGTEK